MLICTPKPGKSILGGESIPMAGYLCPEFLQQVLMFLFKEGQFNPIMGKNETGVHSFSFSIPHRKEDASRPR